MENSHSMVFLKSPAQVLKINYISCNRFLPKIMIIEKRFYTYNKF